MEIRQEYQALGLVSVGRSGWSIWDEISHRETVSGHKTAPRGFVVQRPAVDVHAAIAAACERGALPVEGSRVGDLPAFLDRIQGWCESPLTVCHVAVGHYRGEVGGRVAGEAGAGVLRCEAVRRNGRRATYVAGGAKLFQLVPCRKCAGCRRQKRARWTGRACRELVASYRTWFVTLTFRPEVRYRNDVLCRVRLAKLGADFDALPPHERFAERCRQVGPEATKFLDRLRFGTRALGRYAFRYLMVFEPHADGFPHVHVLVHETKPQPGFGSRFVKGCWQSAGLGFASASLVRGERAAVYVAKYLSKYDGVGRVRSSQGYGEGRSIVVEAGTLLPAALWATDVDAEPEGEARVPVPVGGF